MAMEMQAGGDTGRGATAPAAPDALQRLQALESENERLRATIAEMRVRTERLQTLADTDTLTPLLNRRRFLGEVERALAAVRRYGTPTVLMFADVDGLKAINDAYGHAAGDAALIHVAGLLLGSVRTTDIVARIAGDEFGLLLDHLDAPAAQAKLERLAAAIASAPLILDGRPVPVAVSLGMAMLREGDGVEAVLARADAAMYAARRARRGGDQ